MSAKHVIRRVPMILFVVTLCSVCSYYFHEAASPNPSQGSPTYSPGDISSRTASDRETAAFLASLNMAKTRPMSTVAEMLEKEKSGDAVIIHWPNLRKIATFLTKTDILREITTLFQVPWKSASWR